MGANDLRNRYILTSILTLSSLASVVVAVMLITHQGPVHNEETVHQGLELTETSERTHNWIDNAKSTQVKFFFFEVTNLWEMYYYNHHGTDHKNVVPKFAERGPYVYEERVERQNLTWSENGTVSFIPKTTYYFRADLSQGNSEEDYVVVLNALMVALANRYQDWDLITKAKYNSPHGGFEFRGQDFWNNDVIITPRRKVKDLIWGHNNNILRLIREYVGVPAEEFPETDGLFGFVGKNDTQGKQFEVFTGVNHIDELGVISKWNDDDKLGVWDTEQCDAVSGTDGQVFPPKINSNMILNVFEPDLCRELTLDFKEKSVHKDVPVYRFGISDSYFDPEAPQNECYCDKSHPACGVKGTFSISKCKFGYKDWPLLYSKPHFLHSDVKKHVSMMPNEDDHDSYFDIEPITGTTMASKLRMQINIEINQVFNDFYLNTPPHYIGIKEGIYPMFWFERSFDPMSTDQLDKLKSSIEKLDYDHRLIGGAFLCLSLILIGMSAYLIYTSVFTFRNLKNEFRNVKYQDGASRLIEC